MTKMIQSDIIGRFYNKLFQTKLIMEIGLYEQIKDELLLEFANHPHRPTWERNARTIYTTTTTPERRDWHTSTSDLNAFISVRASFAACGLEDQKQITGLKTLIIGPATGLEVRVACDLGADAIGVDSDGFAVNVGRSTGVVPPDRLIHTSVQDYLSRLSNGSLDVIMANHFTCTGDTLQEIITAAEHALRPGGKMIIWGELPTEDLRLDEDFPVTSINLFPGRDALLAIRR